MNGIVRYQDLPTSVALIPTTGKHGSRVTPSRTFSTLFATTTLVVQLTTCLSHVVGSNREYVSVHYSDFWIGHFSLRAWPWRSPYLSSSLTNYFGAWHVKDSVYQEYRRREKNCCSKPLSSLTGRTEMKLSERERSLDWFSFVVLSEIVGRNS